MQDSVKGKKRILLISRAFYPIIAPRSFRATELAKELARQGHDVTVLTHKKSFRYQLFEKEHNLKIRDFVFGRWNEIKGNSILIKIVRFIFNFLFLFPDIQLTFLLRRALRDYNNYDLLISIAVPYPVHWGVALAKMDNPGICSTWIADCGDPFMGNKEKKLSYPFYFHFVENWFCKKPDYITIPVKEAMGAYPKEFHSKIRIIPQGFSLDMKATPVSHFKKRSIICFAYAGTLSNGFRDPSELLEYLSLQKNKNFKFIVYTKSKLVVEPYVGRLDGKLEVRDYIPREQLLEKLKEMDFLINIENQNNVQSPSKLIDYAIAGRPILSIKPFNLNTEVVDEFLNGDYSNGYVIENIQQYNIKNVAAQFVNLSES